jgi:dihydroorotate dehydrogenase
MLYESLLRPLLFCLDAETAHYFTFDMLKKFPFLAYFLQNKAADKAVQQWGITFRNPVGLAAGFDKNAVLIDTWHQLGFGFVEIGTVTPRPQVGNPMPRLFRLPQDQAIINRMGFNNDGLKDVAKRLEKRKSSIVVGANIGKNKDTDNENAAQDYCNCLQTLHHLADYFVVNISSPNTPNLRALQDKEPLSKLLEAVQNTNQKQPKSKPILLKIAPDLSEGQLQDILELLHTYQFSGIVATNTTISRENLVTPQPQIEQIGMGGLSGKPLLQRSNEIIAYIQQHSKLPIIGVGGIFSADDALAKKKAGAALVQVYSGFVYKGMPLIEEICRKW